MKFINIFLLEQGHAHKKLFEVHGGTEFGALLVYLDQMFDMEFLVEIEFFAEDHPLVHIHLVSRHLHLAEGSPLAVCLL